MLWIGGQITSLAIIKSVFLPALLSMVVPLAFTAYVLRGRPVEAPAAKKQRTRRARPALSGI